MAAIGLQVRGMLPGAAHQQVTEGLLAVAIVAEFASACRRQRGDPSGELVVGEAVADGCKQLGKLVFEAL
jgi:hypothetical protein